MVLLTAKEEEEERKKEKKKRKKYLRMCDVLVQNTNERNLTLLAEETGREAGLNTCCNDSYINLPMNWREKEESLTFVLSSHDRQTKSRRRRKRERKTTGPTTSQVVTSLFSPSQVIPFFASQDSRLSQDSSYTCTARLRSSRLVLVVVRIAFFTSRLKRDREE